MGDLSQGTQADRRAAAALTKRVDAGRQLAPKNSGLCKSLGAIQCCLSSSSVKNDFPDDLFLFNFKL
jgi:hypothetical protein